MSPFGGIAATYRALGALPLRGRRRRGDRHAHRPEKLNALTFEAYADLRDLLAELPHRGDARVLVLTGEGRGFCSGGDVEEIIGELQ